MRISAAMALHPHLFLELLELRIRGGIGVRAPTLPGECVEFRAERSVVGLYALVFAGVLALLVKPIKRMLERA